MTLEEVRAYLDGVNGKQIKLGLGPITALMEALNWPDEGQRIIHVTGTNGKGSVCEMVSQIIQCAGYRVGTFNTPYFTVQNECVRINNKMISDEDLLEVMNQIEPILKQLEARGMLPTGFEILTAIALLYFKKEKADFVILEVGLGGRLDATNVIRKSELSVITKIALDHQNFLGNSLEEITKEKVGIIKPNGTLIMPEQDDKIMAVVKAKCEELKAKLVMMKPSEIQILDRSHVYLNNVKSHTKVNALQEQQAGILFTFQGTKYQLSMYGRYQAYNASLAISIIEQLNKQSSLSISKDCITEGLLKTQWAGRFEKVCSEPLCFLDGAHNVDGIEALRDTLKHLPRRETIAIVGILRDKEIEAMLEVISPYINAWVVTRPLNPRAEVPEVLAEKIKKYSSQIFIKEEIKEAYELARNLAQGESNTQIVGFGSLYMLGSLRKMILKDEC